ncbi:hypothetical protein WICMUC_004171 [Wickerhamomyces mucosus]|uniref:E3 ubiquitin-protein ligase PEP5 n=1 Tax=Wickerhamomyces mucosus TaxID=1378264 RepID=A0A9P8PJI0_9ASCO|nr:hypothetical protein WICMUC_004171 [Wickerhamomyces mucosus]
MSWNQFQFFDITPIKDPNLGTNNPLYSDPSLTSICSTPNYLIISTSNSLIKIIDKQFNLVRSFQAYDKSWNITFMGYIEESDLFATIAERQGQPSILKLWQIDKVLTKELSKLNESSYHALVNIKNGNNSYPITCFTHSKNFNILGFGFANGTVVVVRGDILRDRGSSQTIAFKNQEPITNVHLIKGNNYDPLIYVTTTSKILLVPTTSTYHSGSELVLEPKRGADVNSVDIDSDNLVVGTNEGIVFYNPNGTSYTIGLEMQKKNIVKFGKYILIVTSNTSTSSSLILNGYTEPTRLIIADIEHKLISFNYSIPSTVRDVINLWDDLYILSSDGVLYKVSEKDIDSQIDIVIKRDLYSVAIQIAENKLKGDDLLNIKRKFGGFLYSKNETTEAMDQYIQTLPLGKTSEIIKKYKNGGEVNNLSRFLEEMLNQKLASKEHITLLLCTYCKLKDVDKLNSFIEKYNSEDSEDVEFDLDVVVELCKDTNFLEQGAKLAQNLGYSSLAVDILLRELNDSAASLKYIKTLPIHELLRILVEYARLLLDSSPNITTLLLIDVFTGKYIPQKIDLQEIDLTDDKENSPVLIQSYKAFANFMSNAASVATNAAETVANAAVQVATNNSNDNSTDSFTPEEDFRPTYQPPRPRIIFPSFVSKPNEFVIFLEACAESYDIFEGNEKDKNDILITLFELYLTIGNNSDDNETKKIWENKAIELAKSDQNNLDLNSILLISNIFNFEEGEFLAREGPGFEIDLFRSKITSRDVDGVINILEKYGEKEPELFPLALMFYTSTEDIYERVGVDRLKAVLERIKKDRILSPLEIVQTLSVNKVAPINLIKDYIIELVGSENKEISINEKLIASYQQEIENKQVEIHKLETEPTTIQPGDCFHCSNKIDNDSIRFTCGHIYHKYCLADEDSCGECSPHRENISNIRDSQRAIGERNDIFNAALNEADSRFKLITEFFGKGAMEKVNYVVTEDTI